MAEHSDDGGSANNKKPATYAGGKIVIRTTNTELTKRFLKIRDRQFLAGNKPMNFGFCRACGTSNRGPGPNCSACKNPTGKKTY
jgi:hypothetical protein